MSWIQELQLSWLERFCIKVLKTGPIPKHIALIMDGNRRFAVKRGMEKIEGHSMGFTKLSETLGWCVELGITEITIYVFSIENFKRPKEEVTCLMNLAVEKFTELVREKEKLIKNGVCVRILGDITLLPKELQKLVAEAVLLTYNNTRFYLNVCLAYTARQEMLSAVKDIATAVAKDELKESDINEQLFTNTLYSRKSTNPDIVIRTSGEVRLSDFLLWQSCYSVLSFLNVLWPDFRIWHLFSAILSYQHEFRNLKAIEAQHTLKTDNLEKDVELQSILQEFPDQYKAIENYEATPEIKLIKEQKEIRRKNFLANLENSRYETLTQIRNGNTLQHEPDFS